MKSLLVIAAGSLLSACSAYPLIEDSTGLNTDKVVAKIRCNARDAIRNTVLKQLKKNYSERPIYAQLNGSELAERIEKGVIKWSDLNTKYIRKGHDRNLFDYFKNSQISYDFTFDITESNVQSIDVGLMRNFYHRADTVGFSVTGDRRRNVSRKLTISDNFQFLAQTIKDDYCRSADYIDLIYPVKGRTPIENIVENFLEMNTDENFLGTKEGPAIDRIADTAIFETRITANADPAIALTPPGPGFMYSSFGLKNDNYRNDRHQLLITVAIPPKNIKYFGGTSLVASEADPTLSQKINFGLASIAIARDRDVQDAFIKFGNAVSGPIR